MALSDEEDFVRAMWYGPEGTAKTTALASLSQLGRVIYIDAEAGLKKRALEGRGVITANIEPVRDISYLALDGLFWDLKQELDSNPGSIVGIVWDSATEIAKKFIEQETLKQFNKASAKATARGTEYENDEFFVDRSYWGTMTEQFRRLIRHYRDLPCHLGFAALERRDTDDNGRVSYGPAMNPGISGDLRGYVDIVLRTRVDGVDDNDQDIMVADARKGPDFFAKDRFDALPRVIGDPTFPRVIGYVNGDLDRTTDPVQARLREITLQRRAAAAAEREAREAAKAARKGGASSAAAETTSTA